MTQTKTLRAKSPTDLLACIPTLLGFHPDHSVVMVTAGKATVPVHARADLPRDAAAEGEILAVAEDLADVASRSGVNEVAVVLYTDDPNLASAAGTAMTQALRGANVAILLVLSTDGHRWRVHQVDGLAAPADSGTPYQLAHHPLTVEAVVEGRVVHASRGALRDSLAGADDTRVEQVRQAVDDRADRLLVASDATNARRHLVAEGRWVRWRVRRFLADQHVLDPQESGRLLVAILSIKVRDVAWAEMNHENCHNHVNLWRDVVRHSPAELSAAPAALLAFAAWLAGDGALAWCAVDRCQDADPGYTLAALVTQALAGAVPPAAWVPFDSASLSLFGGDPDPAR